MKPTIAIFCTLILVSTCSRPSRKADDETTKHQAEQTSALTEALSQDNLSQMTLIADSLSLFVDDLSPEQSVQVLLAFVKIHNDAASSRNSRRDLETLRKFVDVYDIALSANPKDMRAAIKEARRINPAFDLDSLASDFRERLTQYDAVQDGSLVAEPTPEPAPDSTAAIPDSVSLVLRPAE